MRRWSLFLRGAALPISAQAQDWPQRPIRITAPAAAVETRVVPPEAFTAFVEAEARKWCPPARQGLKKTAK